MTDRLLPVTETDISVGEVGGGVFGVVGPFVHAHRAARSTTAATLPGRMAVSSRKRRAREGWETVLAEKR